MEAGAPTIAGLRSPTWSANNNSFPQQKGGHGNLAVPFLVGLEREGAVRRGMLLGPTTHRLNCGRLRSCHGDVKRWEVSAQQGYRNLASDQPRSGLCCLR